MESLESKTNITKDELHLYQLLAKVCNASPLLDPDFRVDAEYFELRESPLSQMMSPPKSGALNSATYPAENYVLHWQLENP